MGVRGGSVARHRSDRMRRRLAVRQPLGRARRRTGAAPRLGARQPRSPRMVAAPPQLRRPARLRRGVGRDHRPDRAPAPPQALPQTALRAAHAPVAALHRGAAERCRHPQRAARDHVVQPHGGAAAESAPHGRSRHAHREPAARAGVRALPGATGLYQPGDHPPDDPGGLLPVAAGRPLRRRAAAAAGERRLAPDASRGGAARFRGERLARVALPPHGDLRLPGDSRPGSGARSRYARTGC